MSVESIPIPTERVPPIASDMASGAKTIAAVIFFVGAIFVIAAFGVAFEGQGMRSGASQDRSSLIGGMAFWVALIGYIGYRFARNASRAARAAALAKSDASYTWRLTGKYIVAADGAGVPHPELSFKINQKLRTMLLAVPRAEVRETGR